MTYFDNTNKPVGIRRLYLATKNSLRAVAWLVRNESAFRQEASLLIFTLLFTPFLDISSYEKIALIVSVVFVMFAEIINTAVEVTIDRVGLEIHPLAGLAKDLASAAVLFAMIIASSVWIVVLWTNS